MRTGRERADAGIAAIGRPVAAATAILTRADEFLLVRRHNPPDAGLWGYPGGKIEPGESIMQAAIRELREETGVIGRPVRLLMPFDVIRRDQRGELLAHFVLVPVCCDWVSGTVLAASDARDAAWLSIDMMRQQRGLLSERVLDLAMEASAPTR